MRRNIGKQINNVSIHGIHAVTDMDMDDAVA
jgi:hypothetical protein